MAVSSDGDLYQSGSQWRRWDPHIHAPGTLLNDEFHGDWDGFLRNILEEPTAEVLGITDYFCIETYREAKKRHQAGAFERVKTIFPNVEMRLDIQTNQGRGINIHLLFSPDDPKHESEILRVLGRLEWEYRGHPYPCTLEGLAKLGRAFNPKQLDEAAAVREGANQFKTKLQDLKRIFRDDEWMRRNCLVAVSVKSGDGTSGLQGDASFITARTEIERFAHIIFSSNPSQRDFWLGLKPGFDRHFIEQTYRFRKPCLHGSDAHKNDRVTPDLKRYCWIKGDPTFETLRQAVLEPESRVWLGEAAPTHRMPSVSISGLTTRDTPWLANNEIRLNPGLVSIIGARGSGKTALADVIARGAKAMDWSDKDSFLNRASHPRDYLQEAVVDLRWGDGEQAAEWLGRQDDEYEEKHNSGPGQVCYLSQHFVEQLCSSEGLATELREEMERVIFDSTDPIDKLETDSFKELSEASLEPVRSRRKDLRDSILMASQSIVKEDSLIARLVGLRTEADQLRKKIELDSKSLTTLLPKGSEERAKQLVKFESACTDVESVVETLRKRRQVLLNLEIAVSHRQDVIEPQRLSKLRQEFKDAALSEDQWNQFRMVFVGEVDVVLAQAKKEADRAVEIATDGDSTVSFDPGRALCEWPLTRLRMERDKLKKEVGIDAGKRQKYNLLQRAISDQTSSLRRLETEIKYAEGASERRKGLISARRGTYSQIFETFGEEEAVLDRLYAPLQRDLSGQTGALSKLQFSVNRYVDLDSWEQSGEGLFDLRKDSPFRGQGALRLLAEEYLLSSWISGSADDVATAMDGFREKFGKEMIQAIPNDIEDKGTWAQAVADWLYDTSHIQIDYGIQYEGTAIEQLSPGTRGIVLLLLYLAVDVRDRRPLIIDQPEENLDPNSVYEELVPHFRRARNRRQIIIVTHNANLVVNTDADQVIVAEAVRPLEPGLPIISYRSGSIENGSIRRAVCDTLEGGERAFLEREKRYRLSWDYESESSAA
jgi:ABC-type lipoprotein export system ATPase subunit